MIYYDYLYTNSLSFFYIQLSSCLFIVIGPLFAAPPVFHNNTYSEPLVWFTKLIISFLVSVQHNIQQQI